MKDLLKHPIWESSELGKPLPDSIHAVSVALPTWKDIINYEEKVPECINTLKAIYPRFGLNPLCIIFIISSEYFSIVKQEKFLA